MKNLFRKNLIFIPILLMTQAVLTICPPNCRKCSGNVCEKCHYSYILKENNECELCSDIIDSCLDCKRASKTTECTKCFEGFNYQPTSLSCKKCPEGCKHCDGLQSCKECYSDYQISEEKCKKKLLSNLKKYFFWAIILFPACAFILVVLISGFNMFTGGSKRNVDDINWDGGDRKLSEAFSL